MVSAWTNPERTFESSLIFCGPSTFCRIGPSTLSTDRLIFVFLAVHFHHVWPPTLSRDRPCSPRPVRTFILSEQCEQFIFWNRRTLRTGVNEFGGPCPQRGIILQKLGKKKCWILLGILLLSIVGIAVGLTVHFTATESATTKTPIPLLNATTASPTSTTSTSKAITTTTTTSTTTTTEGN